MLEKNGMTASNSELAITGLGMVSSLGADVSVACSAAYAGITRTANTDFAVKDASAFDMVQVTGHPVGALTLGFAELGLWVRLGALALRNLLQRHSFAEADLSKTAILINLPSDYYLQCARQRQVQRASRDGQAPPPEGVPYSALVPWYRAEYVRKLLGALELRTAPALQEVIFEDQTGILTTLQRARQLLASGRVNRCLVGGVDSLLEPRWLEACNELRILKTAIHPVGFMPGEGAAFLLLEQAALAHREGRPVLALVGGESAQQGAAHRFSAPPPDGRPLREALRASLRQAGQPCTALYCDLNGDSVRSQDWGMALVHLRPEYSPTRIIVPAESFGETRAAYGYMAACQAIQALARGHQPSDTLLVGAAADNGRRGSFTLTRQPSRRFV